MGLTTKTACNSWLSEGRNTARVFVLKTQFLHTLIFGGSYVPRIGKFNNIVCLRLFAEDRMKVLDVIEECQSKPREAPKENTPACGNF